MIPWLLLAEDDAHALPSSVRLCFELATEFQDVYDADPATPEAGDWWRYDDPRPARGVWFHVTDDDGLRTFYADDDGCKDLLVDAADHYAVEVWSKAKVHGVTLNATDGTGTAPGLHHSALWPNVPVTPSAQTLTVVDPEPQVWNLLAVGMWAMFRNTFHYGQPSWQACCDDTAHPWYDDDGTCTWDAGEDAGAPPPDLAEPTPPEWTLEMRSGGDMCGASIVDGEPGVNVSCQYRWVIAHELGHVIVEHRLGARSVMNQLAPLNNCNGAYAMRSVGSEILPGDMDGTNDKSNLSREYQGMALREGWASFFAAWLFNRRTEADCQFDWWNIEDLDLDRTNTDTGWVPVGVADLDNNYGSPSNVGEDEKGDGIVACEGPPVTSEPDPSDPLNTWAVGKDWLERLVAANDPRTCAGDLTNVSTEFDALRFFWDMTKTSGEEGPGVGGAIPPEELADLFVDTCFQNWQPLQGMTHPAGPLWRLQNAAALHGLTPTFNQWKSNGQDH